MLDQAAIEKTINTLALYDYEDIDIEELCTVLEDVRKHSNALALMIEESPSLTEAFENTIVPPEGQEPSILADAYMLSTFECYFGFPALVNAAEEELDPLKAKKIRLMAMIEQIQHEDLYIKLLRGESVSQTPPLISDHFITAALPDSLRQPETIALLEKIHAHNICNIARQKPTLLN